jgi:preprotein translocase SecF subunit
VAALAMIIVYITFRFEFAYALGAVAALGHDVLICTGLFLVWNMGDRQISLPVIAALLTIIGYSLNDTIVVFDRVRENIGLLGKKLKYLEIVNLSINQTLSRTVLTSVTTLLVVVTLYFMGGGAINDFALIMLLGVVVGTYSSVFIATPVMILWHQRQEAKNAAAAGSPTEPVQSVA